MLAMLILVLVLPAAAVAGQLATAPAAPRAQAPSPSESFRHSVRQQQLRDQVQKREVQQQLHQRVADNARLPGARDAQLQQQLDLADQARRDRDRAALQDLLDRQQGQPLPRVIPQDAPASPRSGG